MARNIAATLNEAWRAVIVWKSNSGNLIYEYEGIYNSRGTAQGRVSHWRNNTSCFYDGWIEKADIVWNKVKD
jgi:hypothetical protein